MMFQRQPKFAVLGYAGERHGGGHYWDVFARGLSRKKAERTLNAYADGVRGVAFCGLHVEPDAVADDEQAARRYYERMVAFAEEVFAEDNSPR